MSNTDETLKKMAADIRQIKKHMPNGEMKRIEESVSNIALVVQNLHDRIMDPVSGLIVDTNKNNEFREMCAPEREELIQKLQGVLRWKKAMEWGIGVIFVGLMGAIIKYLST